MSSDTPPPPSFPALLQRAANLLEPVVNAEMAKRARYEGEWKGPWTAGVAACNRYDGGEQGFVLLESTLPGPVLDGGAFSFRSIE